MKRGLEIVRFGAVGMKFGSCLRRPEVGEEIRLLVIVKFWKIIS